jgi:hypothetical protein
MSKKSADTKCDGKEISVQDGLIRRIDHKKCNGLGLPQSSHGLNLQEPLCFLENQ